MSLAWPAMVQQVVSFNSGFIGDCAKSTFLFFFIIVINLILCRRYGAFIEGASLCASCAFVCLFCACMFLSSSSWCRGLAAVCDCGIPWTYLLLFFLIKYNDNIMNKVRNREIMIVHTYIHTRSEDERLG